MELLISGFIDFLFLDKRLKIWHYIKYVCTKMEMSDMTLKEFYDKIEGDFDGTVARLGSEAFAEKFVIRFLNDDSFKLLRDSLKAEDFDEAFRGAHTLKGLCLTLGFSKLAKSGSDITEALRAGKHGEAREMMTAVSRDYSETISAIKEFQL